MPCSKFSRETKRKTGGILLKRYLIYLKFPLTEVNNSSVKPPQWDMVLRFVLKLHSVLPLCSVSSINRLKTPYFKTVLQSGEYKEVVMKGDTTIRELFQQTYGAWSQFSFLMGSFAPVKIQLCVTSLTFFSC